MAPGVIFARLLMAAVCSGLVGFERETARKPAGLRTHTLLGLGSAMFTIASVSVFQGPDEARIAAQIVTGVGFLGAEPSFATVARSAGSRPRPASGSLRHWAWRPEWGLLAGGDRHRHVPGDPLLPARRGRSRGPTHRGGATPHLDHDGQIGKVETLLTYIQRVDEDAVEEDFQRLADGMGILTVSVDPDRTAMLADMVGADKLVADVEGLKATTRHDDGLATPAGAQRRRGVLTAARVLSRPMATQARRSAP